MRAVTVRGYDPSKTSNPMIHFFMAIPLDFYEKTDFTKDSILPLF